MGPLTKQLFSKQTTRILINAGGPGSGRHKGSGDLSNPLNRAALHEKAADAYAKWIKADEKGGKATSAHHDAARKASRKAYEASNEYGDKHEEASSNKAFHLGHHENKDTQAMYQHQATAKLIRDNFGY